MKSHRRVLVITRHFWPATNDDSLRLVHWTQSLCRQSTDVTVATPRWHASWPRRIICDGVRVERIDGPPTHKLRLISYTRHLSQWLAERVGEFDLIYFDSHTADTGAILTQLNQAAGAPVVVRYVEHDNLTQPNSKSLETCRRANLVLTNSPTAQQQLVAAGVARCGIVRGSQVSGAGYQRTAETRRAARQILADVNHDLFARSQDRVLVCPGELSRAWGVPELIRELSPLIEEHRGLRVWILGDSCERPEIYEMLRYDGLHRLVAMPGVFTDLQEVFQAADLCVFPTPGIGLGWLLPTCIASSLPVLVAASAEAQRLLADQADQLTYRADQPRELRGRVAQWLRNPLQLPQCIAAVRKYSTITSSPSLNCDDLLQMLQTNGTRHAQ